MSANQIEVRVISLLRSAERRRTVSERLHSLGVHFTFFDAVDGRALSVSERERLAPPSAIALNGLTGSTLTPGQVGCRTSHWRLLGEIAGATAAFCCVLEDDAVPHTSLLPLLNPEALAALPRFDVLRLHSPTAMWRPWFPAWRVATIAAHDICAMLVSGGSTCGQIISRDGAARILAQLDGLYAEIDVMLFLNPRMVLRVLEVRPGVIDAPQFDSDIGSRPVPSPRRGLHGLIRRGRIIGNFINTWILRDFVLRYPLWTTRAAGRSLSC